MLLERRARRQCAAPHLALCGVNQLFHVNTRQSDSRNEPPTAPPLARSTSDVFPSLWRSILKLENAFRLHTLPYDRPVVSDAETKLYSGRKYWYESASAHLRPRHTRECTRVCVAAG